MPPQRMTELLMEHIQPHQNRSDLYSRASEISVELQSVLAKNNAVGIRTKEDKQQLAGAWLNLAAFCAKVPIKFAAEQLKQQQQEESTIMIMR